jgi:integrase
MATVSQIALSHDSDAHMIRAEGQYVSGHGEDLSRRRYQRGRLFCRRGKRRKVWVGRWWEDTVEDGKLRRIRRSEVLGESAKLTRRKAQRILEERLDSINAPNYRILSAATFSKFVLRWEATVMTQYKPSTQSTLKGHIKNFLNPYFGPREVRDIRPEQVQRFLSGLVASPKTVRNIIATFRMIWKSARSWGYASHDALEGIVLPKKQRSARFFFTVEEVQRILRGAVEPYRTFYWLAAETGMRSGEICGLRVDDVDLDRRLVSVQQSVWHGKVQTPKTETAFRGFALSPTLVDQLRTFLLQWRPNAHGLLFSTRTGSPWDSNLLVKRKLKPLLEKLGIRHGGLHAFRHGNATLMDRLGVPMKVRQQRLGHSDAKMTLGTYTHVASEDDVSIATKLGGILDPNGPKSKNEGLGGLGQALVN